MLPIPANTWPFFIFTSERSQIFHSNVELECTDMFNPNRKRALIRLTLESDEHCIEPDYFALETYLERRGRIRSSVTNIGERLRGGDRLLTSLDLPGLLGPADFPLRLGGKLILRGRTEEQHVRHLRHFPVRNGGW